ncbi:MAG: magnesium-translocating P-type ATPase [Anaerolineales bacterium]|nr:magnesium-translocating P-type ATPase [Anaerolineales bacterium]
MVDRNVSDSLDQYWSLSPQELVNRLAGSLGGLSSTDANRRIEQYGLNVLETRAKVSPLGLFLDHFKSPIILILLFATIVSAIVQEWVDAIIIMAIVVGSAVLSFIQEFSANNAAERLRDQVSTSATVLRDGQTRSIPAKEVAPGDVVLLSAGSLVPADGVLIEAQDFFVNQAVLTGETFPVEKAPGIKPVDASIVERTNCVFMGTNVRSGVGRVLIVHTGTATAYGQIANRLTLRPPETEFERGIRRFGFLLTEVMFVLVLIVFAVNVFFKKPVLDALLFSIALAVGLTPQLLPAIISLNLSKGSQVMADNGVIVRRLEAIENLGSMDVLCTDKTGTLTEGVVQLDGALDIGGRPSEDVLMHAYLNASFQSGLENPLDEAIVKSTHPDTIQFRKSGEIPYDFIRKRLSVLIEREEQTPILITKGALLNVLDVCNRMKDGDAEVLMDDTMRARIHQRYSDWSEQGFRVLGLAYKEIHPCSNDRLSYSCERADEKEMTFEGFLTFFDPPKQGIKETITDLENLGVQLKIITGDNKLVAQHIAQAIDLPVSGILTGTELGEMRDEALWQMSERVNMFVDVDPNQKERIILALQKRGHVVGYMGDGINDAPALHAADVGISVDKAVDVAKEAADFVLLEHELAVLRDGVKLGRKTFANTLKYVFITTSANFGNMFSMAGASLFLPFLPMLPMQILLTNFLTDFPAMGIANDGVDVELVERPRRWNLHFIRNFMFTFGVTSSIFDYLTFGALLFVLKANADQFRTGWFLESILTELLIMLVIRTRRPFFKSMPGRFLLIGTIVVAAITFILPYSPLSGILGLTPLPASILLTLAGITFLYVVFTELVKYIFYKHEANAA